jgi:hypothetical protein
MRLIGIQALLTLLPYRVEAEADASGAGTSIAISNAGVVANASGVGAAHGNLIGIANPTAQALGIGHASAVGFASGIAAAAATSTGIGSSAVVGFAGGPVNAFLNRTSGLDATHKNAYTDLINGLVTDAVWSKLDVLYIFATADTTTALLNLCSTSFTGISNGSPTFAADRGFTGVLGSNTVFINSQFNPTIGTPQFTTNSCHLSAWSVTTVASGISAASVIGAGSNPTNQSNIYPHFSDNNAYFRINDGTASGGTASASATGHWVASRTGASASVGYRNGSSFASPNAAAGTLQNKTFYILNDNGGGGSEGSQLQIAMASIGAGLTGTDVTNFYNRLRTYMTSMGIP